MEPTRNASPSVTWETFGQREGHRRSLFSPIWSRLVPEVFKDVPTYYRCGNIVASLGLWELWVWQFIRTIALRPNDKALDVCAGTNDVGVRLLAKEPGICVTAIDRSAEMQAHGQHRAAARGMMIDSVIHDVHQLPFADHSFDVITLQAASRHLQLDKVLPEILRVLKPGGTFYHCDMLKPGNRVVEWLYLRFLRLSVAATSLIFGSTDASRECNGYFSDAIHHFYTPDELSDVLRLVGFANVVCRTSIWGGMVGFHAAQKAPLLSE
ncbi:class I SAM-dependent methyltransferase [Rhodoferax sp.]|uniref:class I SAM-dependent methyltransferase n=1 Tax=Rhodoferax sp. TaxID=50421 RepID=UPI00272FCECD|nr:class I SAM-dependent methyltransferase [Rhodoferax sp.]MDP1942466.1 class I SAM-dependent methyltransferase [Rhodoferax sp.]MDP2366678.1 class I SAM-dependent methyltransferase [Rhodoferax sp.]